MKINEMQIKIDEQEGKKFFINYLERFKLFENINAIYKEANVFEQNCDAIQQKISKFKTSI